MGFVTGRRGDGFFLQPGLRGRGHGAAFGNRGGGLLGEIAALGNRDDAPARGRPLPLPARGTPAPMHPGKCSPRTPAQAGSWSSQATSPRIPRARRRRPRAEAGVGGTCGSPAEQREPRPGDRLPAPRVLLVTRAACPRAVTSLGRAVALEETPSLRPTSGFFPHPPPRVAGADWSPSLFPAPVSLFIPRVSTC